MFGPEVRAWIVSFDAGGAVAFTRSLLLAEANRLGADLTVIRITGNPYARDRGVDGRTDLGAGLDSLFPTGPWTWQIKAGARPPSPARETAKKDVRKDIEAGRNYVMVWTRDPPSREDLARKLADAVAAINPVSESLFLAPEQLERLARVHPAVVQALGGPSLIGLTITQWARQLEQDVYPFIADEARKRQLQRVREFAQAETGRPSHLHVYGDTGVGKSRLVLEALSNAGLAERAVAAPDYQRVDQARLAAIVSSEESRAIIVVDDTTWDDAKRLEAFAGAASGRIRLITIGDRPSRDMVEGTTSLDITPLSEGVVAQLVERVVGLGSQQAELVAGLAEGFPKLAIEIANAILAAGASTPVIELLRRANIAQLLTKMLPDGDTREDLSLLALVDRVGFEAEVSFETDQLCRAFEQDPLRFKRSVQQEEGRFVSTAGRYRRVTPKAFAMWLVRERIRGSPGEFADQVVKLTEGLFEPFRRQVEILGGDAEFDALIQEVLARRAGWFRGSDGLTVPGARLLSAAAFAVPETAAHQIHEVVSSQSVEELLMLAGERRRELIWALQHLLWFRGTFALAADSLLALAVAENETYGNNATGIFLGAFNLHLGGTEVPLPERIEWLRGAFGVHGRRGAELAIDAAASVLSVHEMRTGGWRGARLQPEEWRPASYQEERASRLMALDLAWDVLDANPDLEQHAAKAICDQLRSAFARGIGIDLLERIGSREWARDARSVLGSAMRAALFYDTDLPEALKTATEELAEAMEGSALLDRSEVMLRTAYWDLAFGVEERLSGPKVIEQMAREIVSAADPALIAELARPELGRKDETVWALFLVIGRLDSDGLGASLSSDATVAESARCAYVAGRGQGGDPDVADSILEAWAANREFADGVAPVVLMLPATPRRADLALEAVSRGGARVSSLNRLLLGAWIRPLPSTSIEAILEEYARAIDSLTDRDIEAAMTMLSFWLDGAENKPTTKLVDLGMELMAIAAESGDTSGGVAYARSALEAKLPLSDEARLELALRALHTRSIQHGPDVELLQQLVKRTPERVIARVVDLILGDIQGWSIYLKRTAILTRLSEAAGHGPMIAEFQKRTSEERARLLSHLDWTASQPDPVFLALVSEADEEFLDAAASSFLFSGEVVVGPYSAYLKRRLGEVEQWREGPKLNSWIDLVVSSLQKWIAQEELREAEDSR